MSDSTVARRSTGARTVPRTLTTTTNPLPSIVATLPPPPPSLSYPYQVPVLHRDGTSSSRSGIVVSLHPPLATGGECVYVCSSSFSSAITFSSFSSSSSARQPTLAFLLASFVRFLLIPESTDHSSLFLRCEHSFLLPRDGLVTRLHRSPLFVRHPLRIPPLLLLVSFPRVIPARQSLVPGRAE